MKYLSTIIIGISLFLICCQSYIKQNKGYKTISKPNVIYINIDDLGWKDLGFMGSKFYDTPNIDKLASEGMVFTQGYASAANCAPSRACLLSGQNTPRHGVYTVGSSERGDVRTRKLIPIKNTIHLADSVFTLAELFQEAGYITGTFGKWHVTNNPLNDGFDLNFGGDHRGNPGRNGYEAPYNQLPNLDNAQAGEYLTDRLTDECIRFINKHQEQRFFVYLPFYAVHTPLMGKEDLIAKYKLKAGPGGQNNAIYAAMVENVDFNVGRVLKKLDELKISESTLIVFTSDNGGINAISSQNPLRSGKGSYYEGGVRVPYIIKWANRIKAGSINHTPITNLDFYPTFKKLLNVETPNITLDGVNIFPLIEGGTIDDRPLFWHFPVYLQAYNKKKDNGRDSLFRTRPGSTVLYQNWKLHHYFEDNAVEVYNLNNDLGEQENIAKKYPQKTKELLLLLNNWRSEMQAPIPKQLNPQYESEEIN